MSEFRVGQTVRVKPDAEFLHNTEQAFRAAGYLGVIRALQGGSYLVSVGTEIESRITDLFDDCEFEVIPADDERVEMIRERAMEFEKALVERSKTPPANRRVLGEFELSLAEDVHRLLDRLDILTKALQPFADEWAAYLEFRRSGATLSFGEWQRDFGSVDEIDTVQAFAALCKPHPDTDTHQEQT